jgi:hypothetical protein
MPGYENYATNFDLPSPTPSPADVGSPNLDNETLDALSLVAGPLDSPSDYDYASELNKHIWGEQLDALYGTSYDTSTDLTPEIRYRDFTNETYGGLPGSIAYQTYSYEDNLLELAAGPVSDNPEAMADYAAKLNASLWDETPTYD